jgi:hypothetical protein
MATLNPDVMYSLRFSSLLKLPTVVQDVISSMHLTPVAPTFIRKPNFKKFKKNADTDDDWRRELLIDLKATIRNKDDPDYETIIGIVNRIVASNVIEKATSILEIISKRSQDEKFRMRAVNLIFDRGVTAPFYSKVMADLLEKLTDINPLIRDDLQIYCSMDTFNKLFDDAAVIVFPESNDPDFDDKVCQWTKQKERRRGFGIFITELYLRSLVPESLINEALSSVIQDLENNIKKPSNKILLESIDQIITFMSEILKLTDVPIVRTTAQAILATPKAECFNLGMRSRFRLEDCIRVHTN